jgi:hypothetical protein
LRYRRRNDVHFAELPDGGLALLDAKRSVFHGCNAVGKRMWELLEQPRTRDEIVAQLKREYAVDPARCEQEAGEFFDELLNQELVEPCDP